MKITGPEEMDKRITLQYQTKAADGHGGFDTTWTDVTTVWAKKTTHRSNEAVQAMQMTGTMIHNFRIWYRSDVKPSWRIKQGNKYMSIIGLVEVNEGPNRYLDITAKETI
jgi:SPP1 family predicted phage head-tail adaptor